MTAVKVYYTDKLLKLINDDPVMANNKQFDQTKIMKILLIGYFLKTLRLILIILNIAYFVGVCWWIMIELEKDF